MTKLQKIIDRRLEEFNKKFSFIWELIKFHQKCVPSNIWNSRGIEKSLKHFLAQAIKKSIEESEEL